MHLKNEAVKFMKIAPIEYMYVPVMLTSGNKLTFSEMCI